MFSRPTLFDTPADRTRTFAVGAGILSFVAFATSVLTFEEAVVVHLALVLVVLATGR